MSTLTRHHRENSRAPGLHDPTLVPMSAIRRYVRRIVGRFHPDKVILFGSYAYGRPTQESDVDLMVIMPARNELDQAVQICEEFDQDFNLDLIVRTPKRVEQRLRWGDWFLRDVVYRGKVLYERIDGNRSSPWPPPFFVERDGMNKLTVEWIEKADNDLAAAQGLLKIKPLLTDQVCFHCQQAIEKYLKARLHHLGLPVEKTHNIEKLLDQLIATDKTLRSLRRGADTLTRFAVDYRYPGLKTTPRQAQAAFEKAKLFRSEIRKRLGLGTHRTKSKP